jgi:two-component system nitrogen regulation response regulator GlnG
MRAYAWPGNVRELRNLCTRLAAMAPGAQVLASDLRQALANVERRAEREQSWTEALVRWAEREIGAGHRNILHDARDQLEASLIDLALQQTGGDRQRAARLLGCGRNTLTRKLGPKNS